MAENATESDSSITNVTADEKSLKKRHFLRRITTIRKIHHFGEKVYFCGCKPNRIEYRSVGVGPSAIIYY
jgi:hypothetical protein